MDLAIAALVGSVLGAAVGAWVWATMPQRPDPPPCRPCQFVPTVSAPVPPQVPVLVDAYVVPQETPTDALEVCVFVTDQGGPWSVRRVAKAEPEVYRPHGRGQPEKWVRQYLDPDGRWIYQRSEAP